MKRALLIALCLFSLASMALHAETIAPDNVSIRRVKALFSDSYGTRIDSDGDLVLNKDGHKVIVMVISKVKLIRLLSIWEKPDDVSIAELIVRANKFNFDKRLLRVCVNPKNGDSYCDYYLAYDGGLNTTNLLEAVDWVYSIDESWSSAMGE